MFQLGFGWNAAQAGLVIIALFAGNVGIKPADDAADAPFRAADGAARVDPGAARLPGRHGRSSRRPRRCRC